MVAIAYDFDTSAMEIQLGPTNYRNGYKLFKKFMKAWGFNGRQGSVLYGNPGVSAIDATRAIQAASCKFPWLKDCVSDIRLLQILHNDDMSVLL